MTIKDLMVGDWVRNDLGETQQVVELREIGAMLYYNDVYSYDEIEPIPLTPEILEKNGWFYPKQSSWMKLDNPHKELWGCIHTDGTFWLYSSGDCDKDECFAEIKYVHKLQHALRLCGIDKEIVV